MVFDSGGRGDKSFNDSAWAGIQKAKAEFGIEGVIDAHLDIYAKLMSQRR